MAQGEVTTGIATPADIQAKKAIVAGPIELEITKIWTTQNGVVDNSIQKGEDFTLHMYVTYSGVLSSLKVNYQAKFHVLNMETGNKETSYALSDSGQLQPGTNFIEIQKTVSNAQVGGVFLLAGSFALPNSRLCDFSLGATVTPPEPLKIANFFVYD